VLLWESQGYLNYGGNTHTYTRLAPNQGFRPLDVSAIQTNVEYIGTHRLQMLAIREIVLNFRPADGKFRSGLLKESSILDAIEAILRKGQQDGEFRAFDLQVMAITIRQAIDVVPRSFGQSEPGCGGVCARTGDPV